MSHKERLVPYLLDSLLAVPEIEHGYRLLVCVGENKYAAAFTTGTCILNFHQGTNYFWDLGTTIKLYDSDGAEF
jgi:hypothetical protein